MKIALSMLILSLFASPSAIAEPCRYAEFQPGFAYERFLYRAHEAQIGVLGPVHSVMGLPAGRSNLIYDGAVVAQISQVRDVAKGLYELTVLHPVTDHVLLQITETKTVCNSGLCHRLQMWTDLQKPTAKSFPFIVTSGPRDFGPVTFSRYGTEVGYNTFRKEFGEAFRWLFEVLLSSKTGYRPEIKELNARLSWALASDADIAPYFDRFSFSISKQDPRVIVVTGTAPSNFVYGRVLDRIRDSGFSHVNPKITIDTRTSMLWMRPRLSGCYH